MKLTYRDKVILITLLVILVWVVGVINFIKPKFDELSTVNTTLDGKTAELTKKKQQVEEEKDLPQRVKKAYEEATALAENFYGKMPSDDVCEAVDNLLDDFSSESDKIVNDQMTLSLYSSKVLSKYQYNANILVTEIDKTVESQKDVMTSATTLDPANPESATNVADTTDGAEIDPASLAVTIPSYSINFGFECKLSSLQEFMDKLTTNNQKSLVISSCNIADVHEDTVTGTLTLDFMMMPTLEDPTTLEDN